MAAVTTGRIQAKPLRARETPLVSNDSLAGNVGRDDIHELPFAAPRWQLDCCVVARCAGPAPVIFRLDEHLQLSPDELAIVGISQLAFDRSQLARSLLLHILRDLVRHLGGGSAAPWAEWEDVNLRK